MVMWVTTPHYQHRPSCLAPQPTGIYTPCPMKGLGLPLGRVQILMLRPQTFFYILHMFLCLLQMYHLFLLERALGTDSPDPFKCLKEYSQREYGVWASPRVRKCASQEHLTPGSYSLFAYMMSPELKLRLTLAHLNFFGRFRILWMFCN